MLASSTPVATGSSKPDRLHLGVVFLRRLEFAADFRLEQAWRGMSQRMLSRSYHWMTLSCKDVGSKFVIREVEGYRIMYPTA